VSDPARGLRRGIDGKANTAGARLELPGARDSGQGARSVSHPARGSLQRGGEARSQDGDLIAAANVGAAVRSMIADPDTGVFNQEPAE